MHKKVDTQFHQILKEEVEKKFGKQVKHQRDCKLLAIELFETTNRQLSVSTIKRFFGLIASPFLPSKFTLDTFSVFLGYENWDIFVENLNSGKIGLSVSKDLDRIIQRINEVSEFSINSIREKTGFHQQKFIHRLFAEEHLKGFLDSEKLATLLVAPKGYGKSSVILQWFNDHFSGLDPLYKNDLVFLVDGGIFFTFYNQPHYFRLLRLLVDFNLKEVQEIFLNPVLDHPQGRFIIVIDDVDKIYPGRDKYHQLAGNIMQLLLVNKRNSWFKIILTCTPENVDSLTSYILQNPVLEDSFYENHFRYRNHYELINVPLFSMDEVRQAVVENSGILTYNRLSFFSHDVLEVIKTPSFLRFFLKNMQQSNDDFTIIRFFNQVIQHFVVTQPFAEEKQLLIKRLMQLCSINEDIPAIEKDLLIEGENLRMAYQELINSGIIHETIDTFDSPEVHLRVRFTNKIVFDYLLARWLTKNNQIDSILLKDIFTKFRYSIQVQYSLLSWIVKIAFSEENIDILKQVHQLMERTVNVSNEIKGESMPGSLRMLQRAYSESLRSCKVTCKVLMPLLAKSRLGQKLYFNEYFDMDNLMFFPEESLIVYNKACKSAEGKMITNYIRFVKGLYSLDYSLCSRKFEEIKKINLADLTTAYVQGYYFAAYYLYASLVVNKVNKSVLGHVLSCSENIKVKNLQTFRFVPPFEFFIIYNLNTCDLFEEVIVITEKFKAAYDYNNNESTGYFEFFKLCYARALLHSGESKKALELFNQLGEMEFPFHIRHFMLLNVNLAVVDFMLHEQNTAKALKLLMETKALAKQMGFKFYIEKADELEVEVLNPKRGISS